MPSSTIAKDASNSRPAPETTGRAVLACPDAAPAGLRDTTSLAKVGELVLIPTSLLDRCKQATYHVDYEQAQAPKQAY